MTKKIKIKVAGKEIWAELNESVTAGKILDILPVKASGNLWGEEDIFSHTSRSRGRKPGRNGK
ncbi:MAG: hypothetical protein ABIH89_01270 [Elusimicrobiota bacterium]